MELEPIVSMAALERMPRSEIPGLIARMLASPGDANVFMNQYQLFILIGEIEFALEMQAKALEMNSVYRIAGTRKPTVRLLALMGQGDTTDNTPLDYLVEGSDIQLDLLYILPGKPLPVSIPEHDVAIVALGESGKNRATLDRMSRLVERWPRPVLNSPQRILQCSRDEVSWLLAGIPGLSIPATIRADRQILERIARQERAFADDLGDIAYPVTIRPVDSQSGRGLDRVADADALSAYLENAGAQEFFISSHIDYRSVDGHYRKVRIALIDGRPYISHLAIGDHWIVHYKSAGMSESHAKREEEANFMRDFDTGFALRHREALKAIAERSALDYVVIDCAEAADGSLLVFEIDNRGWVHATDPVELFAYKQPFMRKAFDAFRAMLLSVPSRHNTPPA